MKIKIIYALLFLITVKSNVAQDIKTYEGNYDNKQGNYVNATAKYDYFENETDDRVYHGKFEYQHGNLKIIGFFENNQRSGKWKAQYYEGGTFSDKFTGEKILTGSFRNGYMSGEWKYLRKELPSNKIIEESVGFFQDGVLHGEYYYNSKNDDQLSIKGFFVNGLFDKEWIIKYNDDGIPKREVKKYHNGIMYFNKQTDESTGESEVKNKEKFVNDFFANFDSTHNYAEIGSFFYTVEDAKFYDLDLNYILQGNQFFWKNISTLSLFSSFHGGRTPIKGFNDTLIIPERIIVVDNDAQARKEHEEKAAKIMMQNRLNSERFITKGDSLFQLKEYKASLVAYEKAQEYRYDTKTKEIIIDLKILIANAKLERKQKLYESYITKGNNFLNEKQFSSSIKMYKLANKELENQQTEQLINKVKDSISYYIQLQSDIEHKVSEAFKIEMQISNYNYSMSKLLKEKYFNKFSECNNFLSSQCNPLSWKLRKIKEYNQKYISFKNGYDWVAKNDEMLAIIDEYLSCISKGEQFYLSVKKAVETNDKKKLAYFKNDNVNEIINLFIN